MCLIISDLKPLLMCIATSLLNTEYRSTEERIEELYKEYPKVMAVLDTEKPSDLSEQECKALIEVLELRNRLSDMQQEAIYFRGCYDSVGYLKKAGIL